mgnify:CR=1 FL=1
MTRPRAHTAREVRQRVEAVKPVDPARIAELGRAGYVVRHGTTEELFIDVLDATKRARALKRATVVRVSDGAVLMERRP